MSMVHSKSKLIMSFLLAAACMVSFGLNHAYAQEKKEKPVRIKWESVEGIIKYRILIKDSEDTVLLDRTVETTFIDFILPPGKYMIRIGAINKFEKISFWTDWEDVELRKSIKTKFFTNDFAAKTGLKVSIGVTYNMIFPPWSSLYRGSGLDFQYLNYIGIIGFHFGNSQYIKQDSFLRFMGIELEGSYNHFDGKNNIQFASKLLNITGGPNIFIKTNLKIPLNFYLRAGGGVSYSIQDFTRRTFQGYPLSKGSIKSLDPYAKVGVSMELNFLYALSLDIGADYLFIFYQGKFFQSVRFIAMLGVRI
jgi:hypothetical protein